MLVGVCLAPAPSIAQLVIDPATAVFNPSPDHFAVAGDTPIVSSYQLELYLVGDPTPFQAIDLGKPGVDPDGVIRIDLASILNPLSPPGSNFAARVAAVGPGGFTRSALSNPFAWSAAALLLSDPPTPPPPELPFPAPSPSEPPPPCTYWVSPLFQSTDSDAHTLTASVLTEDGCSWTAEEDFSWVSIDSEAIGTGSGEVIYSVTANAETSPRSGALTIAGMTITVTQDGSSCTYSMTPTCRIDVRRRWNVRGQRRHWQRLFLGGGC